MKLWYPFDERNIEPELRLKHRLSWFRDEAAKIQSEGYYESVEGEAAGIQTELARLEGLISNGNNNGTSNRNSTQIYRHPDSGFNPVQ